MVDKYHPASYKKSMAETHAKIGRPPKGKKRADGEFSLSLGRELREQVDAWREAYSTEHGFSHPMSLGDAVRMLVRDALTRAK